MFRRLVDQTTDQFVLLADRDQNSRETIAALASPLGLPLAAVDTGAEALAATKSTLPTLILLAVDLVNPSGYEVLRQLRDRLGERLPIAFLSAANADPRDEIAALLLGADDYFIKPIQSDRFMARARRLLAQHEDSAPNGPSARDTSPFTLTRREHEVLALLVEGHRSGQIAELLCITKKTATTHIEHILNKLGAHSQAQAVAFALRHRIVPISNEHPTQLRARPSLPPTAASG